LRRNGSGTSGVSAGYRRKEKPGLKDEQERAMQGAAHTNKGYQKEELMSTESDAQPAVGGPLDQVRSTQRSWKTTASLNMERLS